MNQIVYLSILETSTVAISAVDLKIVRLMPFSRLMRLLSQRKMQESQAKDETVSTRYGYSNTRRWYLPTGRGESLSEG